MQDELTVQSFMLDPLKGWKISNFWEKTLKHQNSIQEENHNTLQSGNACCHSEKNLLSSSLLPKTIQIKIQRTVILSIVVYGYENWSHKLKEEHMLSVFQRKVL